MNLVQFVLGAGLIAVLLLASIIDMREHRIPDVLTLPLIGAGIFVAAFEGLGPLQTHTIGAIAGFASLAIFGEVFFRIRGVEGLGLGDAKLFGAAGAWLGWQPLPQVLLLASVAGLVFALTRRGKIDRDDGIAFGPFICVRIFHDVGYWKAADSHVLLKLPVGLVC